VYVTWRKSSNGIGDTWEFYSVWNAFENGASFIETKDGQVTKPNYSSEQIFEVVDAKYVRSLTRSSDVLKCSKTSICWVQIQSLVLLECILKDSGEWVGEKTSSFIIRLM